MPASRLRVVAALGTAQTLAWASSYYLPALLAAPMARELGIPVSLVFAAFSAALIASALVGPWAGHLIDRHGGRPVLVGTSLLFALGLASMGAAQGPWTLFAAWLLMGVAMGAGLYEAAFSSLVRLYGDGARGAITGITLIAGLASTVGWPLSAWMEAQFGWRGACLGWALLHLLLGLPLNAWLPRARRPGVPDEGAAPAAAGGHTAPTTATADTSAGALAAAVAPAAAADAAATAPAAIAATAFAAATATGAAAVQAPLEHPARTTVLLAFVFAVTWFISTAMAAHLPRMLEAAGSSLAAAVAVGTLIGPAQVAGRLLEFGLLRRVHPLLSARLASLAHPAGVVALLAAGPVLAPVFAVLHGMGNGILTVAKGTLPLALFGPQGYGARQGWLMMPARVAQALAPLLFGLALDAWGVQALWLSAGLALAALGALALLRARGQT